MATPAPAPVAHASPFFETLDAIGHFIDGRLMTIVQAIERVGFWRTIPVLLLLLAFAVFAMNHSGQVLHDTIHEVLAFLSAIFGHGGTAAKAASLLIMLLAASRYTFTGRKTRITGVESRFTLSTPLAAEHGRLGIA